MREKRLAKGDAAYFWAPPTRDLRAGFTIGSEALGTDYAVACERAHLLNKHLQDWRGGRLRVSVRGEIPADTGTLRWMVEVYKRGPAWARVSKRSRPEYERAFRIVLEHATKAGGVVGAASVRSVTALAVDKLYVRLQRGTKVEKRLRTANLCMSRMARAWDYVQARYPNLFAVPLINPFRSVELQYSHGTTRPASRADAFALHRALLDIGEPHLAAVPLVAFEWHQRPENVLAGHFAWTDYRGRDYPNSVRIEHHKTGEQVWLPLIDRDGSLFPELTDYLDGLERLGLPVVLMKPKRGTSTTARLYLLRTARNRVRKAARKAGLPDWLSLAACRHGGLTELGDAELTEQGVMALSGHKSPSAARLYVKRTEAQRVSAARKRRAWVEAASKQEQEAHKSRNEAPARMSE